MPRAELPPKTPGSGGDGRRAWRKARRVLLQVLFEMDSAGHSLEESIRWVTEESPLDEKGAAFVRQIAGLVGTRAKDLDKEIQRYAPAFPVAQLPVVDRNILRVAICEMRVGKDVSIQVAINEAVELAKHFGGENSPSFVNGVLGAVAASMQAPSGATIDATHSNHEEVTSGKGPGQSEEIGS